MNLVKNLCLPILATLKNKQHARLEYEHGLPEEIDFVYMSRYDNMGASFNSKPEGGTVADLTIDYIRPIISKKESKLVDYYRCTEYWLIIVEGNYYAGTFGEYI